MNKTIRIVTLSLASLALLALVAALPAAAAAPGNTFPGGSNAVDNQTHSISPNATLWYNFTYTGDRSPVTLTLVNGNNSGVGFNVFTPAQIGDWWDTPPIGRGTALQLNCTSGLPAPYGACQSNDLVWNGGFNASGIYYVQVVNNNNNPVSFQLMIQGTGVTMAPQIVTAQTALPQLSSSPSAVTTVTLPPAGSNVDPGHASVMDNNSHIIPANTSLWYRFSYAGDRSEITITMPNGSNSGLEFNVFTPEQIGDWWNEQPIGRGTAQALDCTTGLPKESGSCASDDLTWVGKFNAAATYYVQVFNSNDNPVNAQLSITGDGVTLSP